MNKIHLPDYLSKGMENAKTARELCSLLGYKTMRDVTKEVARLRCNGEVICSSNVNGYEGYYLPQRKSELANFIATQHGRIREMQKSVMPAEIAFDEWDCNREELHE